MGLTLVLGPANSAKAGEVLGAYAAAARRGAILVVPTATDVRHYRRELAGEGVVLGSVLTFAGLTAEIGRRAGHGARRLTDLQRRRVLERMIAELGLDALRESADAAGFPAAAGELIAELQRAMVTPERFTAALRAWSAQDVRRAGYARDVGRLYAGYVRALDRVGRVDRELAAWRSLDALRRSPGAWGNFTRDAVFFYGFDDLTVLERDAIETLHRIAGAEVTVSLTYEPGREALTARAEVVEELRPLATRVLQLPARDDYYAPGARAVLHHLERSLFEDRAARLDAAGDVIRLLEAGGDRAEAELVAAEVLGLRRAGVAASEIVVVHRSRARAAPLLARVFHEYGIGLATGREIAFAHTALGRAVLGGARCALLGDDDATAQDLLDYLRAPGLLRTPEIADGLDAEVRCEGLRTAAQARSRLDWPLHDLDRLAAALDPAAELCRMARRLLGAPHRGTAAELTADEALDARAVSALVAAVEELAESELPRPGVAELIELLAELAVSDATGPGAADPSAGDAVLLAEPADVRARRFRAVFVCGLQEGAFPRPGRPEPFLSDAHRHELALASGLRLRAREDALAGERYLFYAAVSRATERVYLSYRSSDEEGNLALPSPFVADVADVLDAGWPERRCRRRLADVVWDPERAPTERERRRALAAGRAAGAAEEPPSRRVIGTSARSLIRHSRILSPGALEMYADCPVRWLVERELRPAALAPDADPITRGNVMHELLERLLEELGGAVTPATLHRAGEILDRLVAEVAADPERRPGAGSPEIVRAAALRAIEADLRRYLEHEAATGRRWRPRELELAFGFDGAHDGTSLPPLALGDGDERVLVRGVVDRVDDDGDGHAVVVDYKSGAARAEHRVARWRGDRQLQVALYMLVVRDLLGLRPVAGLYQPLRGDDLRARGVFVADPGGGVVATEGVVTQDGRQPGELDAELSDAAARAVALASALRAGELTPSPVTCSRDGCAHPAICRSQ